MAGALSCEDENLVDYFIVATKRFDGSAAQLLFVYPPLDDDHEETEFCENVTMFAFPHGYVHSWDGRSLPPPPAHNLFTLTDTQGDHLYGASISFFETANHVKTLCVLTRRPFYTQMLRYLEQLLLVGLHQARRGGASGGVDSVEKALCNLFHEVPVPYRGLSVQMQIGELEILLERPPFLDFPFDVDPELMLYAFMMIDPKVLQQLYHHVLLEHRVLIVGNDSVLVTAVVETLKGLIFPLTWLHVVIPNIPDSLDLSTLLDAPVPFLAGAHTGQLQHVAIPSNVVKYDLTESRLVVPSANNNHYQYQQDLESVVLPALPEASTRLLQKISTTRVADLHTQKKELHQKLWDRRIQLQKCCMGTSISASNTKSGRAPVITPKNFFLVKQSLVYKKMMKLYLEVVASMLQDFPLSISHQSKEFVAEKFVEKKPSATRPFFKAFTETAQFQSFVAQHNDYTAGELALEEAAKFHFVHKTLLSAERATGNQADASLAVTMALTKTFVAHAPQLAEPDPTSEAGAEIKSMLEVVFPAVDLEAFGEPRQILFPSMSTDAVHSSLGTFISPSGVASRRASKDTSDWMQSFMRTVPLPSALVRSELLSSSLSSSSSMSNNNSSSSNSERSVLSIFGSPATPPPMGLPPTAPFKRSRTIDRLKKAAPFCRTMTQKALDSTLTSLASAAAGMASPAAPHTPAKRPATVVRSIWLITTSTCSCRDRIVLLTQSLVEQLQIHGSKTATPVANAYCELIHALAACGHPSEAKAVFEECLSGSALVSLGPIAGMPHFWKPFSALLRCYVTNGLVQRAFDLLVQVEIEEEQLLDPSLGTLAFAAQVLGAEKETMVERSYVTFSCGNLGLRLAPRSTPDSSSAAAGVGCELIAFHAPKSNGENPTQPPKKDGASLKQASGLRVHDVVETINGEFVMHHAFQEIITGLKQASRPMTVTFVRGLDRIDMLLEPETGGGARRSSSSASVSSTSAVVDGQSASSSSKSTPRRDLCDRFGLLPQRGIRVTALADCDGCGTRLNLSQVQRGWASGDANDYTTRCVACGHRFVPRLCVMLGVMTTMYQPALPRGGAQELPQDAQVEQFEYLSMPVIRKELSNLAQKVPLSLLSMKDLRERHARIYWNMVVKLLSLDVPLDFLDLPDATTKTPPSGDTPPPTAKVLPAKAQSAGATAADDEMRQLRDLVLKRAERLKSGNQSHVKMEDVLSSVLKALEQQTKEVLQAKAKGVGGVPGRKRWSLLGSLNSSSSFSLRGATTPTAAAPATPPATASAAASASHGDEEASGYYERRRSSSDDERETDVEDMRSSRTVSVTDSIVLDDASDAAIGHADKKPTTRGAKFMQSLPSAPFQRSSRALPSAR